jgi:hypothetical protein
LSLWATEFESSANSIIVAGLSNGGPYFVIRHHSELPHYRRRKLFLLFIAKHFTGSIGGCKACKPLMWSWLHRVVISISISTTHSIR